MAAVSLIDSDRQWLKSHVGPIDVELPREVAFCARAIEAGPDVFEVEDATGDERFKDNPLVTGNPNIRFYAGHPLESANGHRLGTLCIIDTQPRRLTEGERQALVDLALWAQKEMTVDEELERAAAVQASLLPTAPPQLDGYQVAGRCVPSRAVGGDFYDWYMPREGALAFTTGDVMGKGMPAAIMMATIRAALRAASRQPSFVEAVRAANAAVYQDLNAAGNFVTMFGGHLDARSGVLRYVDAGHGLAMILRRDGSVDLPETRSLPFGIDPEPELADGRARLEPGEMLLVYSDGLQEALGDAQPAEVASIIEDCSTAAEAVDRLVDRAGRWTDDVTAIAVLREPQP